MLAAARLRDVDSFRLESVRALGGFKFGTADFQRILDRSLQPVDVLPEIAPLLRRQAAYPFQLICYDPFLAEETDAQVFEVLQRPRRIDCLLCIRTQAIQ